MNPKEWNKTWVDRFWNKCDLSVIEELVHPECIFTEFAGGTREVTGWQPLRESRIAFDATIADANMEYIMLIGDERWAMGIQRFTGTMKESGQKVKILAAVACEIEDSLIVRAYNHSSFNQPDISMPGWTSPEAEDYFKVPDIVHSEAEKNSSCTDSAIGALNSMWGAVGAAPVSNTFDENANVVEISSYGKVTSGGGAVSANTDWFRSNFSEPTIEIHHSMEEGNAVAVLFTISGRLIGNSLGFGSEGNLAKLRGQFTAFVRDGKVFHAYSHIDFSGIGQELPIP